MGEDSTGGPWAVWTDASKRSTIPQMFEARTATRPAIEKRKLEKETRQKIEKAEFPTKSGGIGKDSIWGARGRQEDAFDRQEKEVIIHKAEKDGGRKFGSFDKI